MSFAFVGIEVQAFKPRSLFPVPVALTAIDGTRRWSVKIAWALSTDPFHQLALLSVRAVAAPVTLLLYRGTLQHKKTIVDSLSRL